MMYVKHIIEMDLAGRPSMPCVDVVQGDQYARQLELSLSSNGEKWEIPEDVHPVVRFRKTDGTGGAYDTLPDGSPAWSVSGNTLTVTLAPQVLTCPGSVMLSVTLVQGDFRITAFSILVNVHGAVPEGLESGAYSCFDGFLSAPKSAEIGQYFRVSGVNDHGVVSQIEAVTLPSLDDAVDAALTQARQSGEFDGASAYEIAVKNGFSGTEEAWLESLHGKDGKFNTKVGDILQINITGKLTTDPGIVVDFGSTRLRGVKDPDADTDAATKQYVDRAAADYVVPAYWQQAVEEAAAGVTVNQDAGGIDCMTFALFGDIHAVPGETLPNPGHTGNLAAAVMDACRIPLAICCGDVGRTDADSEDAARKSIAAGAENLSPIGFRRLLQVQGDYDGACGTAQMNAGTLFGAIFRGQAADDRRHFGGDGSYFYVDYPAAKIRLILLNSCWTDDAHLRTETFGYGNNQLNWLADTALSLPAAGWGVVLAAHVPPVSAYSAKTRDMTVLRGILTAFQNQTKYTGTAGTTGQWDSVSVSCDFTGKNGGEIIGFFCGHSHSDSIVTDETTYPIVTVMSDAMLSSADGEDVRTAGTAAEHAIDFVTVNRSTKTVSMVRLGAGENRSCSYQ